MSQICIAAGEACVDCAEYAAAFSCLPKIKISGMPQLSKLDTISILDTKCEDILLPITSTSCETGAESHSLSLKDLLDIIGHTSVGEKQAFSDKDFTAEGQVEEYELTLFNPSETRDMQVSYFAQWSANIEADKGGVIGIDSNMYIDGINIVDAESDSLHQGGYDVYVIFGAENSPNQDAGTMPFFYTKIIPPKTETKIIMELVCNRYEKATKARAETIQLMITGVTK